VARGSLVICPNRNETPKVIDITPRERWIELSELDAKFGAEGASFFNIARGAIDPPQMKRERSTNKNPIRHPRNAKRIVIVDDHPLFRHGLTQLINSNDDYAVCGEAGGAPEAMAVIRKVKPDLVIVDLGLQGPNGIELTKSLRVEFPKMLVLILSMHDEPTYAVRSLRAGANGYVTKQEALGSVLVAIREVTDGRVYLSPVMASEVISNVVLSKREPGASPTDNLTDRELEILERIAKGEEVKSIAKALHLSPKTVETHRAHIKEKLNLSNARQVTRYAVQWASARES
jgi:DNA-binding NarL/FixJ family response regulator